LWFNFNPLYYKGGRIVFDKAFYDELTKVCDPIGQFINRNFKELKHPVVQGNVSQALVKLSELHFWCGQAAQAVDQLDSAAEKAVAAGDLVDMTGEGVKIVGGGDGST
jgi:hypothetical protein